MKTFKEYLTEKVFRITEDDWIRWINKNSNNAKTAVRELHKLLDGKISQHKFPYRDEFSYRHIYDHTTKTMYTWFAIDDKHTGMEYALNVNPSYNIGFYTHHHDQHRMTYTPHRLQLDAEDVKYIKKYFGRFSTRVDMEKLEGFGK